MALIAWKDLDYPKNKDDDDLLRKKSNRGGNTAEMKSAS